MVRTKLHSVYKPYSAISLRILYNISSMSPEKKGVQQIAFDEITYNEAMGVYNAALSARSINMDSARALVASMQENSPILRTSIGTSHFLATMNLLDRLSKIRRTIANSDFVEVVPGFAQAVLQDLNGYTERQPEMYLMPAYQLAKSFASLQDFGYMAIAIGIFAVNFDKLMKASQLSNRDAEELVKHVKASATPQQIRTLVREAITPDSALSKRFPRPVDSILNLSILGNNTYERPARMAAILDEFTDEQSTEVLSAWHDSHHNHQDQSSGSEAVYFEHFSAVCKLEQLRPGITKVLIDRYGIYSFARYPLDLLVEQYDTRDEKDIPYSTFVVSREDHSGAILSLKDKVAFAHKQATSLGFRLKINEARSLEGIIQRINTLAELHGRISCALLVGHEFDKQLGELAWNRDAFTPTAAVGLISCFTGVKNGTAQLLSSTLRDVDVHGPDHSAYLKKNGVVLNKVNGLLDLRVLFGYGEGNFVTEEDILYAMQSTTGGVFNIRSTVVKLYDVATRVYRNGQPIRDYT